MKNILIVSGHTNLDASVANKKILEVLTERLPEAEIVRLDRLYPDFRIDVAAEQARLLKADVVVLQFPIFWYSAPSTGAPEALYAKDGPVGFALDDFLACFKATCRLCRMEYAGEIHTCGVSYASRTSEEQIESQNKVSTVHAERLVELLKSL